MKNIVFLLLSISLFSCKGRKIENNNNHYTTLPEIGRLTSDLPAQSIKKKKYAELPLTSKKEIETSTNSDSIIQTVDTETFSYITAERITQIVDVRTPEEFAAGHIYDAVNMNINDSIFFTKQIMNLNRDRPVAVYCRSGVRSLKAAEILKKNNFKIIYNLEGGIKQWTKESRNINK